MPTRQHAQTGTARAILPKSSTKPEGDGIPHALKIFDALPDSANVRQPVVQGLYGCSSTTIWRRVKAGLIPKPKKLGGTTVWNVADLRAALRGES